MDCVDEGKEKDYLKLLIFCVNDAANVDIDLKPQVSDFKNCTLSEETRERRNYYRFFVFLRYR